METRELTCIGCPMGCQITVEMDGGNVVSVTGNTCKIGDNYARKEVVSPMRIVTSSVAVASSAHDRVSVKTASDVPKGKIMDVMREIRHATAKAPVHTGDVLIADFIEPGTNLVACKDFA